MEDLHTYIRDARSFGQPDAQIRSVLLHQGWKGEEIDRALRDTPPAPPRPPEASGKRTSRPTAAQSFPGILITLLIGVLMLGAAYYFYGREADLAERGVVTTGVLAQVEHSTRTEERDSGDRTVDVYSPVYAFEDAGGQAHRFSGNSARSSAGFRVGQEVDVLYDPQNPGNARLAGGSGLVGIVITALLGGLMTLLGIAGLVMLMRKRKSAPVA